MFKVIKAAEDYDFDLEPPEDIYEYEDEIIKIDIKNFQFVFDEDDHAYPLDDDALFDQLDAQADKLKPYDDYVIDIDDLAEDFYDELDNYCIGSKLDKGSYYELISANLMIYYTKSYPNLSLHDVRNRDYDWDSDDDIQVKFDFIELTNINLTELNM